MTARAIVGSLPCPGASGHHDGVAVLRMGVADEDLVRVAEAGGRIELVLRDDKRRIGPEGPRAVAVEPVMLLGRSVGHQDLDAVVGEHRLQRLGHELGKLPWRARGRLGEAELGQEFVELDELAPRLRAAALRRRGRAVLAWRRQRFPALTRYARQRWAERVGHVAEEHCLGQAVAALSQVGEEQEPDVAVAMWHRHADDGGVAGGPDPLLHRVELVLPKVRCRRRHFEIVLRQRRGADQHGRTVRRIDPERHQVVREFRGQ